eukprot:scaffold145047_cov43-Prasinocladus_malaysianus.AAC.3
MLGQAYDLPAYTSRHPIVQVDKHEINSAFLRVSVRTNYLASMRQLVLTTHPVANLLYPFPALCAAASPRGAACIPVIFWDALFVPFVAPLLAAAGAPYDRNEGKDIQDSVHMVKKLNCQATWSTHHIKSP